VLRQLRKYGEAAEPSYVALAAHVLLAFRDDEDRTQPRHTSQYSYHYNPQTRSNTYQETKIYFDSYSRYQAFYYILFRNSARYVQQKEGFVCVSPFEPGGEVPAMREEAFPQLWNQAPEQIIGLLSFSNVQWVHDFALKVWNANPVFEKHVGEIHIIQFLQAHAVGTQRLGLALAQKKYDPAQPQTQLLAAMVDSQLEDARKQATEWITAGQSTLLNDSTFVLSLLKMRRVEAHSWLRGFLAAYRFPQEQAEIIIASAIAFLMAAEAGTEEDRRYIQQISDTLILAFGNFLANISLDIVRDLFKHPSAELHTFAGKILVKHVVRPEDLPEDFLKVLLTSDNPHSRSIGITLLGNFPDPLLLQKKDVLVSFCLSPLPDVRNAVKPIISRLTQTYPEFGNALVTLFVPAFLIKESYEGLHDDLLDLLSHELAGSLGVIPREKTLLLLNSRYRTSQLIGNILLKKTIADDTLTIVELVKLGNNPLADVRSFVWNTFKKYPDKVKASKEDAIKITDTDWDDTRIFAFDFFRDTFTDTDWNADILTALCDSTRDDVQGFAREMITKFFEADQGHEYLLKLSQHPSSKVQLFTTTYLAEFASGKIEVMTSLKLYFITLLSQVNKGRVAKMRVMELLRAEARKGESMAQLASEIFVRVSVSMAIAERAGCIAALRDIRKQFPAIQMPMAVKEFSDYVRN
jgi:hypothetical protein